MATHAYEPAQRRGATGYVEMRRIEQGRRHGECTGNGRSYIVDHLSRKVTAEQYLDVLRGVVEGSRNGRCDAVVMNGN